MPVYCKNEFKENIEKEIAVAQHGKKFKHCWVKAAGKDDSEPYNSLPYLDAT